MGLPDFTAEKACEVQAADESQIPTSQEQRCNESTTTWVFGDE
jgi:hypothetical protein